MYLKDLFLRYTNWNAAKPKSPSLKRFVEWGRSLRCCAFGPTWIIDAGRICQCGWQTHIKCLISSVFWLTSAAQGARMCSWYRRKFASCLPPPVSHSNIAMSAVLSLSLALAGYETFTPCQPFLRSLSYFVPAPAYKFGPTLIALSCSFLQQSNTCTRMGRMCALNLLIRAGEITQNAPSQFANQLLMNASLTQNFLICLKFRWWIKLLN